MHFDLVIVGGGLVGASLAASLQDQSLTVALIDAKMPTNNDPRLFALNQTSCQFLENLQIWPQLENLAAPIHEVHVSQRKQFGAVRLRARDVDLPVLGYVIPAFHIETALNEKLQTLQQVTCFRPAVLTELQQETINNELQHRLTIKMQNETVTITTPLIVGADGADSTVRRLLQMEADTVNYEQIAIVTRTRLQRSHQHIAYERFNSHGAIAMLPLINNECATIWTADNKEGEALFAMSDDDFLKALQANFGYRLGRMLSIDKRHRFPLKMVRAKESVRAGAILLGSAAHALHPIAAQGFNLALYEVAVLAESLQKGLPVDLQQVNANIQNQINTSVSVSHRLSSLFADSSPLIKHLLPLGLVGMDKLPVMRRSFINKMLGRSGHIPSLLLSASEND